jgi:hypothetical protein
LPGVKGKLEITGILYAYERLMNAYMLLSCPVNGAVSSTLVGTVSGPTTGTGGTIYVYTT